MPREPKLQKTVAFEQEEFDQIKAACKLKGKRKKPAAYIRESALECSERDLWKAGK